MTTQDISYNKAIAEITAIIKKIESEELDVDMLAQNVEHVNDLLKICRDKLTKTEDAVEKIINNIK